MTDKPLTEPEMVLILEEIAREGTNAAARIAAIKQLRDMRRDQPQAVDALAKLDELAGPRGRFAGSWTNLGPMNPPATRSTAVHCGLWVRLWSGIPL